MENWTEKKLPKPELKEEEKLQKCTTKTEKLIYNVISEILNKKDLDINTPFITLGLDSLGIIQAQTKLISYNYVLNTQDFYRFNTIKTLAENIDTNIYTYKTTDAQVPIIFRHTFDEILSKIDKKDNRNIEFSENNLYIGQNYNDNVYVHSKFEAEKIVLEYMEKGLNAQIHRIGILAGR